MSKPAFKLVEDVETSIPSAAPAQAKVSHEDMAMQMLALALRTISQRFVIAVSNLFTLVAVVGVGYLYSNILHDPSVLQITSVSIFAVFVLLVELIRRRK